MKLLSPGTRREPRSRGVSHERTPSLTTRAGSPRLRLGTLPFFALFVALPAHAQPIDPAAADAIFQKGREAAEHGDWLGACPKFAESQRLDPAPGTLLNLADCEEHLGALASSFEHFKTALETMAGNDDRIPFARQHMAALEKKVPHLTLRATDLPQAATVMRDEVLLGSASFGVAIPIDPGQHRIVVKVPGHVDNHYAVLLRAGESQTLAIAAGEDEKRATVALPVARSLAVPPPPEAPQTTGSAARGVGFALLGIGGAGLVAGAVTGALVLNKKSIVQDPSHCDLVTHACDQTGVDAASDGRTFSTVSTVAFVAGGASLVTGIVLLVLGERRASPASGTTVAVPETYAGGAGLRVIHTF